MAGSEGRKAGWGVRIGAGFIVLVGLPLLLGGKDPLLNALRSARAKAVSVKTGEPVANQLVAVPPSCVADASRIAARVPALSFGYTTLNAKHQDARLDIALATDISQAFADLKVALPGLGSTGTAPLGFRARNSGDFSPSRSSLTASYGAPIHSSTM